MARVLAVTGTDSPTSPASSTCVDARTHRSLGRLDTGLRPDTFVDTSERSSSRRTRACWQRISWRPRPAPDRRTSCAGTPPRDAGSALPRPITSGPAGAPALVGFIAGGSRRLVTSSARPPHGHPRRHHAAPGAPVPLAAASRHPQPRRARRSRSAPPTAPCACSISKPARYARRAAGTTRRVDGHALHARLAQARDGRRRRAPHRLGRQARHRAIDTFAGHAGACRSSRSLAGRHDRLQRRPGRQRDRLGSRRHAAAGTTVPRRTAGPTDVLAVTAQGTSLAVPNADGSIDLLDSRTLAPTRRIQFHAAPGAHRRRWSRLPLMDARWRPGLATGRSASPTRAPVSRAGCRSSPTSAPCWPSRSASTGGGSPRAVRTTPSTSGTCVAGRS